MGFLNKFRKRKTEYLDDEGVKEEIEERRVLALHKEKEQKLKTESSERRKLRVKKFVEGTEKVIETAQKGYGILAKAGKSARVKPRSMRRAKIRRARRAKPKFIIVQQDSFGNRYSRPKPKRRARRKPREDSFGLGNMGVNVDFFGSKGKKQKEFKYF